MYHHELLASALAVSKGRKINPEFRIGAMVSHVPIYPYSSHPDDVMLAEETMRQRFSSRTCRFADIIQAMR